MNKERVELLEKNIDEIRLAVDDKTAVRLQLDKCNRVVDRLDSFSNECETCTEHFNVLEEQIMRIKERQGEMTKEAIKIHHQTVQEITSHLEKQHGLISENYYMSIYMSLGLSFGLLIGLVFMDNIALGLPIGMVLGIAIGTGKDREAKKRGKVI